MEINKPLKQAKAAGTIDEVFEIDCVADATERQKNIDHAASLGLPRVIYRKRHKRKVAIVGSGPSATDYVDMLKEWDGEIWAVNRAFEWLRHRGVEPSAFIGVDPEWFLIECLPDPPDVTYYIASQVNPKVFEHLKGKNVRLWFMADGQIKQPFGAIEIYGGSTALGRAPNLAHVLGFRDVHIIGGDSSFTHKTHVHGGELPPNTVTVEVDGVAFKTTRVMLSQACEFVEQMIEWSRMKEPLQVTLYGNGLMPALYAQQVRSGLPELYIVERSKEVA